MFPVWWYSRGLLATTKGIFRFLQHENQSLALSIWVRNIFVPMYGQTDWQGRAVSIFIRLIQIIFRSFLMLVYVFLGFIGLLVWLAAPLFIIYQIIFQLI